MGKYGNVAYNSPCGLTYKMNKFGASDSEESGNHDPVGNKLYWVKKPQNTALLLHKIAETSPELADKLFSNLQICNTPKQSCIKTNGNMTIEYNGKSTKTCGGKIIFPWLPSGFEDVRKVVSVASEVLEFAAGK